MGGVELVAPTGFDPDIPFLIASGFAMAGTARFRIMEGSACHVNVARRWKAKNDGLVGVGTGYALSGDGLWRQHSWGIRRDGILETTTRREKYFGVRLKAKEADSFARCNC
jgi:hypothetical protein